MKEKAEISIDLDDDENFDWLQQARNAGITADEEEGEEEEEEEETAEEPTEQTSRRPTENIPPGQ